ncbi:MAG: hypothetical protein V3S07_06215 [Micropepsaceae bacterium]
MRHTLSVVSVIALLAGVAPSLAHEEFRLIGTITGESDSKLVVTEKSGRVVLVALDNQTYIHRDSERVDVSEVTEGSNVVVDAWGDDYTDLLALEIRLVPSITAPTN